MPTIEFTCFDNRANKRNPKAPDFTGEVKLKGEPHNLAVWIKDGKNGQFYSGRISPKEERKGASPPP